MASQHARSYARFLVSKCNIEPDLEEQVLNDEVFIDAVDGMMSIEGAHGALHTREMQQCIPSLIHESHQAAVGDRNGARRAGRQMMRKLTGIPDDDKTETLFAALQCDDLPSNTENDAMKKLVKYIDNKLTTTGEIGHIG